MIGSPAGPGGPSQRGLWSLAPAPAPAVNSLSTDGLNKCGVYSFFPGGSTFGSALAYSHASTIGRYASGHLQQSSANTFHAAHKVSDSLFSTATYSFGAPTPPPCSPYSPIPVTQLELLAKGFSNNIIIQQQPPLPSSSDFLSSPKKIQITEKRCDEKCCTIQQRTQKGHCHCQISTSKKIQEITTSGCSRAHPIEWPGICVKKEPGSHPCQVAEITTSVSPVVKVEVSSPNQKPHDAIISGSIITNSVDNAGPVTSMAANISGAAQGGGTVLQYTDDRVGGGLAAWPMGGNHNQTLATPTLWQYPAPVPVEPMVPLPVPAMPPVGFQLVRDPAGGLLLLPTTTTGIEPLQQTVVWPNYPQPSSVLLPSLPSMQPPPLQLLGSSSTDYLSTSTTLHQHTQTHSTRLVAVTTDTKRKIPLPLPATTLIKIETDGTIDQSKALQAVSTISNNTGTVFTADQAVPPIVTAHVIYQHPTNLILSQPQNSNTDTTLCRSQATSPVATCLTPPPDSTHIQEDEIVNTSMVQDASNQTDMPICSEDDNTTHTIPDIAIADEKIKEIKETQVEPEANGELEERPTPVQVIPEKQVEEIQNAPIVDDEAKQRTAESLIEKHDLPSEQKTSKKDQQTPDISGLQLLSNSIVEFENCRSSTEEKTSNNKAQESAENSNTKVTAENTSEEKKSNTTGASMPLNIDDNLGGLELLCVAVAEQQLRDNKLAENIEPSSKEKSDRHKEKHKSRERKKEKRKKRHSSNEPRRKKMKSDKRHGSEVRRNKERRRKERKESAKTDKQQSCSCQYKHYKTPETEQEVQKFLESKSPENFYCKREWPSGLINALELKMRMQLAQIQKQFRDKQKELGKLKPKKRYRHLECSKKRSKHHSLYLERSFASPQPSSPLSPYKETSNLLKPSKLSILSKLKHTAWDSRLSQTDSTPEKYSSSKSEREVNKLKRLHDSILSLSSDHLLVGKRSKEDFRHLITPSQLSDDIMSTSKIRPKLKAEATIKLNNEEDNKEWEESIRDQEYLELLKADDNQEVDEAVDEEEEEEVEEDKELSDKEIEVCYNNNNNNNNEPEIEYEISPTKLHVVESEKEKKSQSQTIRVDNSSKKVEDQDNEVHEKVEGNLEVEEEENLPNPCALTDKHLKIDKLRILKVTNGLFYAGQLNAIEPPDIYSITLDGERGNKPEISCREEILKDIIVEVLPKSKEELPIGTRLCAYWSQQQRCLYPGSVAEPETSDSELDDKFVFVEFDDGDSGKINLRDIRLIAPNYPIVEYNRNPLEIKRKRRLSTYGSEHSKSDRIPTPTVPESPVIASSSRLPASVSQQQAHPLPIPLISSDFNLLAQSVDHKQKKRLKKRKKEKRKHKCTDELCKHKKHRKKHKKHKKHHDNEAASSTSHQKEMFEDISEDSHEPDPSVSNVDNQISGLASSSNTISTSTSDLEEPPNKKLALQTSKRKRQESTENRSKMRPFLPEQQIWHWAGPGIKRPKAKKVKCRKFVYYKTIERGDESISVGDAAVFISSAGAHRPYTGRIISMWEGNGKMSVEVEWFYHAAELPNKDYEEALKYPGALFQSDHTDTNEVQTISHKCEVLPFNKYLEHFGEDLSAYNAVYENNDLYYLAGSYRPKGNILKFEPDIPMKEVNKESEKF